jgi:hypothetical protein
MEISIIETPLGASATSHEWLHTVIESACRDFAGRVTQQHILDVVGEVASRYRDARVTSYLPMMVSRFTRERLVQELGKDDTK